MKVLLVNTLFEPYVLGGAERSVKILATYLKKRGLEPVVLTTFNRNKKAIVDGITVYYMKTPNIYWPFYAKKKPPYLKPIWHAIDAFNPLSPKIVKGIIRKEKIKLMHTNNLAGFSPSIWNLELPKVHTLRDMYLMCIRSTMFKNGRECKRQCTVCSIYSYPKKRMSHKVEAVSGISRYILEKHLKAGYFPDARIKEVVYNPIEKIHGRKSAFKPPIILGYVGSIVPHKGIELLLNVFQELNPGNAILKVFGKSPIPGYEERLRKKFENEKIKFMGFLPESEVYPQIHILVVPSLWNEPFGRIIPEAYSFGIPVIASMRGGIPEIVVDGETGFLFENAEQLKERIRYFLENPEEITRMGGNALEYARKFLPENTLEKYMEIYWRLI